LKLSKEDKEQNIAMGKKSVEVEQLKIAMLKEWKELQSLKKEKQTEEVSCWRFFCLFDLTLWCLLVFFSSPSSYPFLLFSLSIAVPPPSSSHLPDETREGPKEEDCQDGEDL
jgi:hypothetical protein